MTRSRVDGLCLLALGAAMFVTLGFAAEHLMGRGSLEDFKALLGWELGHLVWMSLIAACFIVAAYLAWTFGANDAPLMSGSLIGLMLVNGFGQLTSGNSAGIVVSLCVIAVWCFVRERFVYGGVLCLSVGLMLKPHDAGLIWLFFLLAGRTYRKRALQTLLVTVLLYISSIAWASNVAPHWGQELRSNLAISFGPLGQNNPGPSSLSTHTAGMIIDLQTVFSILRDDPHFYDPASYLFCGFLLLAWVLVTLRADLSPSTTWLALAAIAPLSMLATYHRTYDAKIILLSIPACAMLWVEGRITAWLALAVTSAGMILTGDFPLVLLVELTKNLQISGGISERILIAVLTRPVPLVLLAMGTFYLWIYFRRFRTSSQSSADSGLEKTVQVPTPSA